MLTVSNYFSQEIFNVFWRKFVNIAETRLGRDESGRVRGNPTGCASTPDRCTRCEKRRQILEMNFKTVTFS